MLTVAIGLVLVVASVVALLFPFRRRVVTASLVTDPIEDLRRERERVYEEVRSLQHDYDLGHIPEKEHQARLQAHRLRAAALLQQQEDLKAWDQRLEGEILTLRKPIPAFYEAMRCPECGREMAGNAKQCAQCGARVSGVASSRRRTEQG